MNLTAQQKQIAYQIDKDVQIIGQNAQNKANTNGFCGY